MADKCLDGKMQAPTGAFANVSALGIFPLNTTVGASFHTGDYGNLTSERTVMGRVGFVAKNGTFKRSEILSFFTKKLIRGIVNEGVKTFAPGQAMDDDEDAISKSHSDSCDDNEGRLCSGA